MAATQLSKDEIADKGEQIYEAQLRDVLEPGYIGKFVAIDVNSGEYAVGDTILQATDKMAMKVPEPENYVMKVGFTAAVAMGGRLTRRPPRAAQ
jgi:peptide subunit release factor RF-3